MVLLFFASCIVFMSCDNKDARKVKELQAKLDSIERVDSLQRAEEQRIKLAKQEWEDFTSTDLKQFFLKGHVKEVIYTEKVYFYNDYDEHTYTLKFSEEGKLTYHSAYKGTDFKKCHFKRNNKGQIIQIMAETTWDIQEIGEDFRYNKEGYPCFHSIWASDTIEENYTIYNENHWPTKGRGYEGNAPITYTYSSVDDHGNWTTQKTIVHYTKVFENDKDQTSTTQRTIKYYDFHE